MFFSLTVIVGIGNILQMKLFVEMEECATESRSRTFIASTKCFMYSFGIHLLFQVLRKTIDHLVLRYALVAIKLNKHKRPSTISSLKRRCACIKYLEMFPY